MVFLDEKEEKNSTIEKQSWENVKSARMLLMLGLFDGAE